MGQTKLVQDIMANALEKALSTNSTVDGTEPKETVPPEEAVAPASEEAEPDAITVVAVSPEEPVKPKEAEPERRVSIVDAAVGWVSGLFGEKQPEQQEEKVEQEDQPAQAPPSGAKLARQKTAAALEKALTARPTADELVDKNILKARSPSLEAAKQDLERKLRARPSAPPAAPYYMSSAPPVPVPASLRPEVERLGGVPLTPPPPPAPLNRMPTAPGFEPPPLAANAPPPPTADPNDQLNLLMQRASSAQLEGLTKVAAAAALKEHDGHIGKALNALKYGLARSSDAADDTEPKEAVPERRVSIVDAAVGWVSGLFGEQQQEDKKPEPLLAENPVQTHPPRRVSFAVPPTPTPPPPPPAPLNRMPTAPGFEPPPLSSNAPPSPAPPAPLKRAPTAPGFEPPPLSPNAPPPPAPPAQLKRMPTAPGFVPPPISPGAPPPPPIRSSSSPAAAAAPPLVPPPPVAPPCVSQPSVPPPSPPAPLNRMPTAPGLAPPPVAPGGAPPPPPPPPASPLAPPPPPVPPLVPSSPSSALLAAIQGGTSLRSVKDREEKPDLEKKASSGGGISGGGIRLSQIKKGAGSLRSTKDKEEEDKPAPLEKQQSSGIRLSQITRGAGGLKSSKDREERKPSTSKPSDAPAAPTWQEELKARKAKKAALAAGA